MKYKNKIVLGIIIAAFVTVIALVVKHFYQVTSYKADEVEIELKLLKMRLIEFKSDCGQFPTSKQGLKALMKKPEDLLCEKFRPDGYVEGGLVPVDPWDHAFKYESDGEHFMLKSDGEKYPVIVTDEKDVETIY